MTCRSYESGPLRVLGHAALADVLTWHPGTVAYSFLLDLLSLSLFEGKKSLSFTLQLKSLVSSRKPAASSPP